MSTISINGNTITGSSIVMVNGRVIINGKDLTPEGKEINIVVNGNIEKVHADYCTKIEITGEVGNVETQAGDIDVSGNVKGNIQTMSGDVDCGNVGGSISTMAGNVKHRR